MVLCEVLRHAIIPAGTAAAAAGESSRARAPHSRCTSTLGTKEEGPISDQVRKLTNVGRPKAEPAMLLLDIPDSGGFYVAESAEISAHCRSDCA